MITGRKAKPGQQHNHIDEFRGKTRHGQPPYAARPKDGRVLMPTQLPAIAMTNQIQP